VRSLYLTVTVFFISLGALRSTPELTSRFFNYRHLKFELIIRHENDAENLYYKGVSEILSSFIDSLISAGKLQDKKFEISVTTAVWMDQSPGVIMYKSPYSYYCSLNGLVQKINLSYLLNIINYFTTAQWESFYYDTKTLPPKTAVNIFNRKLPPTPAYIKHIVQTQKTVVDSKLYDIVLKNDSLFVFVNGRKHCRLSNPLPVEIKDRVIIANGNKFEVISGGQIIGEITLTKSHITDGMYEQPFAKAQDKWVNYNNINYCFLSYSYDRNKFYKLKKE
jgi:hypothetical protein